MCNRTDTIDKLVTNLQVTDEERRRLVNTRIEPAVMGTVLDFLYREAHADSVPPILQLTKSNPTSPLEPVSAKGRAVVMCRVRGGWHVPSKKRNTTY